MTQPAWKGERPLKLIFRSLGTPRKLAHNVRNMAHMVWCRVNRRIPKKRLKRLQELGYIEEIPSIAQLRIAARDQIFFTARTGLKNYYRNLGINMQFHNFRRVLEDPASMLDRIGVFSHRDTLIGHLLQVVHLDPVYDFQILEMFEDGLDELERQTHQIIEGTHIRQRSIMSVVEDPAYHARLLDYIKRYRDDKNTEPLKRKKSENDDPYFLLAKETFDTFPGYVRYASRLPKSFIGLIKHRLTYKKINPACCDPEKREKYFPN